MEPNTIRLGFDAKRYFHNQTGLGNYARWLIDGLSEHSQLDLALFNTTAQDHPLPIYAPAYPRLKPLWRTLGIKQQIQAAKLQIYHGLSNEIPFGIHKLAVKSVVTIHDLINFKYPKNYNPIDRIIYAKKLSYAVNHAHRIVVPSESTKKDVLHYFKTDEEKIRVIGLSVKHIDQPSLVQPGKHILCVSSFTERKNLVNLVKAYSNVPGDTPLVIAGAMGETFGQVQALAQKDQRIKLNNNVSSNHLKQLYEEALFCVYPSVYEGFGIPILEAFTHGKTIATSQASSMPEVGGEAAVYFDPLQKDSIATALSTLLKEEARKKRERLIPKQLKKFDSTTLLAAYADLYQELIN